MSSDDARRKQVGAVDIGGIFYKADEPVALWVGFSFLDEYLVKSSIVNRQS